MLTKHLTSLISARALIIFIVCNTYLYAAEAHRNQQTQQQQQQQIDEISRRVKRQFGGNNFGNNFGGGFGDGFGGNFGGNFGGGFGRPRPGQDRRGPVLFPSNNNNNNNVRSQPFNGFGNQLIFSGNPNQPRRPFAGRNPRPFGFGNRDDINNNDNNNNNNSSNNNSSNNSNSDQSGQLVFINNEPTVATMAPFVARTTASPQFLSCFNSCQTTSEYNPICASNQELYFNEQKFNCAKNCGANIEIVRRGSCEGLVQMVRG